MLSVLDDFLGHQITEPFSHVATSDRNFYDRYYFNLHACSDDFFAVIGFGQYPNLGTQDCFVAIRVGQQQTVLRSSTVLGDRGVSRCGPLSIEVLQGLKSFRIKIDPNESGIEADLRFEGVHVPLPEPRQTHRVHGALILDVLRFGQNGSYSGWIRTPDRVFSSEHYDLQGYRDRSWGLRPVGERVSLGRRAELNAAAGATGSYPNWSWGYATPRFNDFSLMLKLHEDNNGARYLEDATRIWHDPDRPVERLGKLAMTFELGADRRYVERARLSCQPGSGESLEINLTQLLPLFLEVGTGYGRAEDQGWTQGEYRGPLVTDVVSFDLSTPQVGVYGGIDSVSLFEFDGEIGYGLFEYVLCGKLDRYGLKGPGYWNQIKDGRDESHA